MKSALKNYPCRGLFADDVDIEKEIDNILLGKNPLISIVYRAMTPDIMARYNPSATPVFNPDGSLARDPNGDIKMILKEGGEIAINSGKTNPDVLVDKVRNLAAVLIHEIGHYIYDRYGYDKTQINSEVGDTQEIRDAKSRSNTRNIVDNCFPDSERMPRP